MIEIAEHAEGLVLAVRAQPGARCNAVGGEQAGALKVAVTVAAEKGKANRAAIAVLAEALGLKRSQVTLLTGETSRHKRFLVRGISAGELAARLDRVVAAPKPL